MGSRGEGAHRPTMRGASRSARTFTGGARRRPAPSSTFTLGGARGSTPAPGVPGPVRTGGGGASTVCGVDCDDPRLSFFTFLHRPIKVIQKSFQDYGWHASNLPPQHGPKDSINRTKLNQSWVQTCNTYTLPAGSNSKVGHLHVLLQQLLARVLRADDHLFQPLRQRVSIGAAAVRRIRRHWHTRVRAILDR